MNYQIVPVVKSRPIQRPYILQNPNLMWLRKDRDKRGEFLHNESIEWLRDALPLWSRLNKCNTNGQYRSLTTSKIRNYDVEIDGMLYSLWGNLHPNKYISNKNLINKSYVACCIVALCATRIYPIGTWSAQILDSTIVNGEHYCRQSVLKQKDLEQKNKKGRNHNSRIVLSDLPTECWLDNVKFHVRITLITEGKLYCRPNLRQLNLAEGLMHFFQYFQIGLLQCQKRCLAVGFSPGPEGGYFLYDCQSWDRPLFPKNRGSSYVLLTKNLQLLLYCLVVALNVPLFHQTFTLYSVELDSESCDPLLVGIMNN